MHRFYAPPESFADFEIVLGTDETRHLRDVLRLREGAEISVFDGHGREFHCTVKSIGKKKSMLTIVKDIPPASPESGLRLTVAAAMLKGDKFDLVVQKSVELGVAAVIPLQTIRCDVKPGDSVKRLERWRRIALEATKQCGRARLMTIDEPIGFDGFIVGSAEEL
ncbi:MAG: RsmE family RNA methyltransferase, partial [Pyrinomonadaceae bacterium]